MPVQCCVEWEVVGQEGFHGVDWVVMREVFDIHNELGRFCDERIYQEELAQRCRARDFDVRREVELRVTHQGFCKSYYLDLLLQRGIIYELKTVRILNRNHEKQLINYLLLSNLQHGKLVNFRPASVESRYVSTSLSRQDRANPQWLEEGWDGDDKASCRMREVLRSLLDDWGTFLDTNLYRDALLHFLDGPTIGVQPVDIQLSGKVVGSQKMCLLDAETAWHVSAVRQYADSYETHIRRLLQHTHLTRIHWINFHQRSITLKTII